MDKKRLQELIDNFNKVLAEELGEEDVLSITLKHRDGTGFYTTLHKASTISKAELTKREIIKIEL